MIDEHEMAERRASLENAIANQRLEGLEIDPVTLQGMERFTRGEIELEEVLRNLDARVAAGAFRKSPVDSNTRKFA